MAIFVNSHIVNFFTLVRYRSGSLFALILGSVFVLIVIGIAAWISFYKIWYRIRDKRVNLMNGIMSDVSRAVTEYEQSFGTNPASAQAQFPEWKNKYNYIREFINFSYVNLGLEKEYVSLLNRYYRYINQQNI